MRTIKLLSSIALLVILSLACSSSSDSGSAPSCESLTTATDNAAVAYANATSSNQVQLCNAYKTALQNEINGCGDEFGDLQATLNDLSDCTIGPINSSIISVKVGQSLRTYETNVTVRTVGPNREIKAYDNVSATDYIFFTIPIETIGTNKISNFNLHLLSSDYNILPVDEGGISSSNITTNSNTAINGTFYGYVTSLTTGADLDLTQGTINISL
jgi:hypothetical protein